MTDSKKYSRREFEAKIIAHAWKDENFKRKLLSNPEEALREFYAGLPKNYHFKVYEEKENEWTLVLPSAPIDSKKLSESELLQFAGGDNTDSACSCAISASCAEKI
jgi:hypothetical protein